MSKVATVDCNSQSLILTISGLHSLEVTSTPALVEENCSIADQAQPLPRQYRGLATDLKGPGLRESERPFSPVRYARIHVRYPGCRTRLLRRFRSVTELGVAPSMRRHDKDNASPCARGIPGVNPVHFSAFSFGRGRRLRYPAIMAFGI